MRGDCVFVDASFWISLRDARELQHARAQSLIQALFREQVLLVLTLPVWAEIHAYFCRSRLLKERILADLWNNPVVRLEEITYRDQEEAVQLLRLQKDKDYSLCDALSFVVMRRLGLRRAASYDHHFGQFGEFEVLS